MKDRIRKYILDTYEKTRWPYIPSMLIRKEFGDIDKAIQELIEEGFIYLRSGVNGILVTYIEGEKEVIKNNEVKKKSKHGKHNH